MTKSSSTAAAIFSPLVGGTNADAKPQASNPYQPPPIASKRKIFEPVDEERASSDTDLSANDHSMDMKDSMY